MAVPFGLIHKEDAKGQLRHGIKVFLEFAGVGFLLAWILYWL